MSFLNQTPQDTALSIQGCGYKIENDRVIVSVDQISNNRDALNMSGTLLIELCALSQQSHSPEHRVLASTTIGEMKGQHFLANCYYDLLFQSPPKGVWKILLQLSEWNGVGYTLHDQVAFNLHYQTQAMSEEVDHDSVLHIKPIEQQAEKADLKASMTHASVPLVDTVTKGHGYLIVNKAKAAKLKAVKGVPKKALEKVIAERPFQSEQAIINIKGMGPTMLRKILAHLNG